VRRKALRFFEITLVLVRLDDVASFKHAIRLWVCRPNRLGRNRKSSPKASTDVPMGRGM